MSVMRGYYHRLVPRLASALIVALILLAMLLPVAPVHAAPLVAFWVGGTGNWSDAAAHWALASGGAPGAGNLPDGGTDVYIDAASGSGFIITVDTNAPPCGNHIVDFTGADNPTLDITHNYHILGDATFIAGMTILNSGVMYFEGADTIDLITAGHTLPGVVQKTGAGTLRLQEDLTLGTYVVQQAGVIDTNGYTLSTPIYGTDTASVKTLTGTVSTASWSNTGTNLTVSPGTVIRLTGTAAFVGGSIVYDDVQFLGTAHAITGNNTFTSVVTDPSQTTTLTFAAGDTQTVTTPHLSGSAGHTHTLTGTAGWALAKAGGGDNTYHYLAIVNSNASPASTWYYAAADSAAGGSTGWISATAPTVVTGLATPITMNKDGVNSTTMNATVSALGGYLDTDGWLEYGLTAAYGANTTTNVGIGAVSYTGAVVALTPGATYHYRATANNDISDGNGADSTFTLTLPTVTTAAATGVAYGVTTTATLNGNVTNMGVCSDTYVRFNWGYTAACSDFATAQQTIAGISAVTAAISGFTPGATVYYRTVSTTGGVTTTGAVVSFATSTSGSGGTRSNTLSYILLYNILPLAVSLAVCIAGFFVFRGGNAIGGLVTIALGLVAYVVIQVLVRALF